MYKEISRALEFVCEDTKDAVKKWRMDFAGGGGMSRDDVMKFASLAIRETIENTKKAIEDIINKAQDEKTHGIKPEFANLVYASYCETFMVTVVGKHTNGSSSHAYYIEPLFKEVKISIDSMTKISIWISTAIAYATALGSIDARLVLDCPTRGDERIRTSKEVLSMAVDHCGSPPVYLVESEPK